MAARSKAWVWVLSLAGISGSNLTGEVMSLSIVVCLSVIPEPKNDEAFGQKGSSAIKKKRIIMIYNSSTKSCFIYVNYAALTVPVAVRSEA